MHPKRLLILHSYYQQLSDFCEDLRENSNHFFRQKNVRFFSVCIRIERLSDHSQMLREYALQIREMEQSQIDARQNRTMRIVTVVTTIFSHCRLSPGGWHEFFSYAPELSAPHAYGSLIGNCAVIVLIKLVFHKTTFFPEFAYRITIMSYHTLGGLYLLARLCILDLKVLPDWNYLLEKCFSIFFIKSFFTTFVTYTLDGQLHKKDF